MKSWRLVSQKAPFDTRRRLKRYIQKSIFSNLKKNWFDGILKSFKCCLMVQEEHKMAAEDVEGFKIKDTRFYSRILESSKKWRCSNWANPARPKKQYTSRNLWSPKFLTNFYLWIKLKVIKLPSGPQMVTWPNGHIWVRKIFRQFKLATETLSRFQIILMGLIISHEFLIFSLNDTKFEILHLKRFRKWIFEQKIFIFLRL